MKEKKITRILSGAAMAAMMTAPTAAMAATTSTLDNPNGGAPISVEHPMDTAQLDGTNNTHGTGAKQNAGATRENTAIGTDVKITVHNGSDNASFDTAVGHDASINGSGGTALGTAAKVDSAFGGTAVGAASMAQGGQMGTAVGYMSTAEGNFATAVGANASAKGVNSEAIGANTVANTNKATAIGIGANAAAQNSVALGADSVANEINSVSVGKAGATRKITNVTAGINGTDAVNVDQLKAGLDNKANIDLDNISEAGKTVIKNLASAKVDINSTSGAITVKKEVKDGQAAFDLNLSENQKFNKVDMKTANTEDLNVTGNTVIGTDKSDTMTVNATTNFNSNVTFNKGAEFKGDIKAQSVTVGDKTYITETGLNANNQKIVNVANGTVAQGSKDAVNGGQLYQAVTDVRKGIQSDIDKAAGEVGAQAAAMSSLHPLEYDRDNKVSVAASFGGYKDETAGAVGAFYRPDDRTMVSLQGAFGANDNMYGVGYSQKFGGHAHDLQKLENMSDVKDAMAKLQAENDDLKAKYAEIVAMLSARTSLPMRVVSEIVVADKDQQTGEMTEKVNSMLGYGDGNFENADSDFADAADSAKDVRIINDTVMD